MKQSVLFPLNPEEWEIVNAALEDFLQRNYLPGEEPDFDWGREEVQEVIDRLNGARGAFIEIGEEGT